jgi:hypothetical protein
VWRQPGQDRRPEQVRTPAKNRRGSTGGSCD